MKTSFFVTIFNVFFLIPIIIAETLVTTAVYNIIQSHRRFCLDPDCIEAAAFIQRTANLSADPCQDFYEFSCGGFLASQSAVTDVNNNLLVSTLKNHVSIYDLYQRDIETSIQEMLLQRPSMLNVEENSVRFYRSCLDHQRTIIGEIDNYQQMSDNSPSTVFLRRIAQTIAANNFDNYNRNNGALEQLLVNGLDYSANATTALFQISVERDLFNAAINSISIGPTQTFYFIDKSFFDFFSQDDIERQLVPNYVRFLRTIFRQINNNGSLLLMDETLIEHLVDLEMGLAHLTPPFNGSAIAYELGGNDEANVSLASLNKLTPAINWTLLLHLIGQRYGVASLLSPSTLQSTRLTVYDVSYFRSLSNYLIAKQITTTRAGLQILQSYVALTAMAPYFQELAPQFVRVYSSLISNDVTRVPDDSDGKNNCPASIVVENNPDLIRRRCLDKTKRFFGLVLSRNFVEKRFPPEAKARIERMAEVIRHSFIESLQSPTQLTWLDDDTRRHAVEKALAMSFSIGYPDEVVNSTKLEQRYADYGRMSHLDSDYWSNLVQLANGTNKYTFKLLDKPPRRFDDWGPFLPIDQNAEYDPMMNAIHMAAAYCVEPFFKVGYPNAFNWAGIGQALSHEVLHGYDTFGSRYDEHGQIEKTDNGWWSDWSLAEFQLRTQCFIDQYSAFSPLPGYRLNGSTTLNENIADNGGLTLAYNAFKFDEISMSPSFSPLDDVELPVVNYKAGINGLTNEQIFFLVTAMNYCEAQTPGRIKDAIDRDVHSPPRERVNGMMVNSQSFAAAYKCRQGTPMNPYTPKCQLW